AVATRSACQGPAMTNLDDVAALAATEHHLAVVSTLRADSTIRRPDGRRWPSSPTAGSSWPTSASARR
ncbi:MAG TPA: hypothetical protein VHH34_18780, partial [Pseudonocardiaceae bacterium]|nr:hypothetical protein [Pseudonocardiaceae bacterium]